MSFANLAVCACSFLMSILQQKHHEHPRSLRALLGEAGPENECSALIILPERHPGLLCSTLSRAKGR